jgi:hypothetical protein
MKTQLELNSPADDFRLVAEESTDGERVIRERERRESDLIASQQQQTDLTLPT